MMLIEQAATKKPNLGEQRVLIDERSTPTETKLGQPTDPANVQKQVGL
jgi:hypothetical protein